MHAVYLFLSKIKDLMLLVMRMCSYLLFENSLEIFLNLNFFKSLITIMRERNSDGIKDLPNYATF